MISLLGSLLGFGSSLVGLVLEAWNKSSDQTLEATIVEADMAEIVAAHKEQASTVREGPTWLSNPGVRSYDWGIGVCKFRA